MHRHAKFHYVPHLASTCVERFQGRHHGTDNRILHGNHRKVDGAVHELIESPVERFAGIRRCAMWPRALDGEFAESSRFSLKCDDWYFSGP